MHNRHDQLAKNLLRDALTRASSVETEVEVVAAAQKIDVYCVPDTSRAAERAAMGLLGELSVEPSLFEPFSGTPSLRQVRTCLRKQLTWHHELERRARGEAARAREKAGLEKPKAVPFPALVVIGRGRPETVLEGYGCQRVCQGVYRAVRDLDLRVVVVSELPRTRDTLLLRLLGSGRVLREALADFSALPDDVWEKGIATPLLLHFQISTPEPVTTEEDDVSAEIQAWYKDYQQKQQEARAAALEQGLEQGRTNGTRSLLLRLLRARFGELPEEAMARIGAVELEELERWGERVLDARTLDEALDETM